MTEKLLDTITSVLYLIAFLHSAIISAEWSKPVLKNAAKQYSAVKQAMTIQHSSKKAPGEFHPALEQYRKLSIYLQEPSPD
jgi:hypothetical protein